METIQDIRGSNMITQKQAKVLKAIVDFMEEKNLSPTVRELGDIVGLNSPSTVQGHIDSLEKIGCITRISSSPRTILVTDEGKKLLKLIG